MTNLDSILKSRESDLTRILIRRGNLDTERPQGEGIHTEEHSSDSGFVDGSDQTRKRTKGTKDNFRTGAIFWQGEDQEVFLDMLPLSAY